MPSDGQEVSQQSLEIKQNDKFFTRIMSKESSMANSSNRVYYGGASGAIPFMWESRPGTPKHTLADTCLPPLTPPPSYHSSSKSNSMHKNNANPNILTTLFHRFVPKRTRMSPSSSMSSTSSSSSSCSPFYSSQSNFMNSKSKKSYCFSSARSLICYRFDERDDDYDNDGHGLGSPISTSCYDVKRKAVNGCHGYHFMRNMKSAVL
jgi:hypothetical protein